jgi:hypothetical protein
VCASGEGGHMMWQCGPQEASEAKCSRRSTHEGGRRPANGAICSTLCVGTREGRDGGGGTQ